MAAARFWSVAGLLAVVAAGRLESDKQDYHKARDDALQTAKLLIKKAREEEANGIAKQLVEEAKKAEDAAKRVEEAAKLETAQPAEWPCPASGALVEACDWYENFIAANPEPPKSLVKIGGSYLFGGTHGWHRGDGETLRACKENHDTICKMRNPLCEDFFKHCKTAPSTTTNAPRGGLAKRPRLGRGKAKAVSPRPECVALMAAKAAYRFKPHFDADIPAGKAAAEELGTLGYTFVKFWNASSVPGDWDYMGWWHKEGACMITFMGSDSMVGDFLNNMNFKPIDKWGISGVHAGLVAELEPLVTQVDFAEIRGMCKGPITAVGHSLGGGLAQLFALAVNSRADPLGAKLKVDFLYTFGPMPVTDEKEVNAQASDGCFAGGMYLNSLTSSEGTVQVDVVKNPMVGGGMLLPVKTKKVVLRGPGEETTYECGTFLPEHLDIIPAIDPKGPGGLSLAWLHAHNPASYGAKMGC